MSRPFQVDISESAADLKQQLQVAREGSHKEKLQMLWWLKSGQVCEHLEIGQRLGRNPSTVTRWLQTYRQGGLVALLAVHKAPGAQRKMSSEVLAALQKELETGPGFSSYGAIVQWLEREQGQRVEYGTVYHWVRYRLGAKLKVPRPQSYKQDPTVLEEFKKN